MDRRSNASKRTNSSNSSRCTKCDKPNELILKLTGQMRDRVVNSLKKSSKLVCSKIEDDDRLKKELLDENEDIMQQICKLPLIGDNRKANALTKTKIEETPADSTEITGQLSTEDDSTDDIIFELGLSLKNRIVNNFSKHRLLLGGEQEMSNDAKIDLIEENKFLISALRLLRKKDDADGEPRRQSESSRADEELRRPSESSRTDDRIIAHFSRSGNKRDNRTSGEIISIDLESIGSDESEKNPQRCQIPKSVKITIYMLALIIFGGYVGFMLIFMLLPIR